MKMKSSLSLGILMALGVTSVSAESLLVIKEPAEFIKESCAENLAPMPESEMKARELQNCYFAVVQEYEADRVVSELKKAKFTKEDLNKIDLSNIRTKDALVNTIKQTRPLLLEPQGKKVEYERVSILFKTPEVTEETKKAEEKKFYQTYNAENYNLTKEEFAALAEFNKRLLDQEKVVKATLNEIKASQMGMINHITQGGTKNLEVIKEFNDEFKKVEESLEKAVKKEADINNAIFTDYESAILARKFDAGDYLDRIIGGEKITLSKAECKVLNGVYASYNLEENHENLKCGKWLFF